MRAGRGVQGGGPLGQLPGVGVRAVWAVLVSTLCLDADGGACCVPAEGPVAAGCLAGSQRVEGQTQWDSRATGGVGGLGDRGCAPGSWPVVLGAGHQPCVPWRPPGPGSQCGMGRGQNPVRGAQGDHHRGLRLAPGPWARLGCRRLSGDLHLGGACPQPAFPPQGPPSPAPASRVGRQRARRTSAGRRRCCGSWCGEW